MLPMQFDKAIAYLLSLGHETLTIKLGLSNTERLLAALGDPHKDFLAVQIAGTNGKGSTAVMLESICRAAGVRTGLFTSPHLVSITERIRLDGEQVSEEDFAHFTTEVKKAAEELIEAGYLDTRPTFFEHITAIALLAFRAAKVNLAILETGLGGRLDSTTAADAQVVAITQISMDHQEYLGQSLAEIAAEKAAITKPGVVAIVAPQPTEALEVIVRRCERVGVQPRLIDPDTVQIDETSADGRVRISLETVHDSYKQVWLGLRGRHQIENAATAIALAEALRDQGFSISHQAIIKGLATAHHPGRLEIWEGPPRILFDGAHNPAAARALRDYLEEFIKQPITMIFGAMRDKALKEMGGILFPAAKELILTEIENPRAALLDMMKSAVPDNLGCRVHQSSEVREAIKLTREITSANGLICVTGSLYLVGEVQHALRDQSKVVAR